MRRRVWRAAALLVVFSCESPQRVQLAFFFSEICPSCEDYERAEHIAGVVLELAGNRRITGEIHNIVSQEAQDRLEEVIRERGTPDVSLSLPILFVDDRYVVGYEEIEEELAGLRESYARRPGRAGR
jgi:hypothetical protein